MCARERMHGTDIRKLVNVIAPKRNELSPARGFFIAALLLDADYRVRGTSRRVAARHTSARGYSFIIPLEYRERERVIIYVIW